MSSSFARMSGMYSRREKELRERARLDAGLRTLGLGHITISRMWVGTRLDCDSRGQALHIGINAVEDSEYMPNAVLVTAKRFAISKARHIVRQVVVGAESPRVLEQRTFDVRHESAWCLLHWLHANSVPWIFDMPVERGRYALRIFPKPRTD